MATSVRETSMAAFKRDDVRHASGSSGSSWLSRQQRQPSASRVRVTLLVEEDNTLLEPIVLIVQKNAAAQAGGRRLLAAVAEAEDEHVARVAPDILANTADSTV